MVERKKDKYHREFQFLLCDRTFGTCNLGDDDDDDDDRVCIHVTPGI